MDDNPTRVERPIAERATVDLTRARRPSAAPEAASTVTSPGDFLLKTEIGRVHVFFWVALVAVLGIVAALPFLGGDRHAKIAVAATMLSWIGAYLVFKIRVARAGSYRDRDLVPGAVTSWCAGLAATYFWGVFSPAPAIVAAALFVNSLIGSLRYTLSMYLAFAIGLGVLGVGVTAGVVDDRGLITAAELGAGEKWFTHVLIQFVLLASFASARLSRRTTVEALDELDRALRSVAQREALLSEARVELERAAWAGGPGRYTEQVIGSFQLGEIIGRGAMGEVYDAAHTDTGEAAAVKLLHRNVEIDADGRRRFSREVTAAAAIRSPHVVAVLEVGDEKAAVPYLAMERLRGADLAKQLRRRRRLPVSEVVAIVREVGDGLEAARRAGVVHRDLKPHNVFGALDDGGRVVWKILDFGVSKLVETSGTLTSGGIVGTPNYMAPEQARGEPVDHRADVYSLGAIAYRALTGQPPFLGRQVATTVYDVVHRMPPRPGGLADLSPAIDAVLALALCKDREQRFASAVELADALADAAADRLDPALAERAQQTLARKPWGDMVAPES